jgi:hypothetical protein
MRNRPLAYPASELELPIPAGVIVSIDVVELKWRLSVDLHDSLSASHGIVMHVGIEKGKAPCSERFHLVGIELIAHADFERPGNDRDVFPLRVPMGSDAEPIRHLQANGKVAVEAVGSPSRTANCAPGRTTGGAGPQGIVSGVNAFFS